MLSAKVFYINTEKCHAICKMTVLDDYFHKTSLTLPLSIKKSLKIPT